MNKRYLSLFGANVCKKLPLRNCGVLIYRSLTGMMFCYQTDRPITGRGRGGGGITGILRVFDTSSDWLIALKRLL